MGRRKLVLLGGQKRPADKRLSDGIRRLLTNFVRKRQEQDLPPAEHDEGSGDGLVGEHQVAAHRWRRRNIINHIRTEHAWQIREPRLAEGYRVRRMIR